MDYSSASYDELFDAFVSCDDEDETFESLTHINISDSVFPVLNESFKGTSMNKCLQQDSPQVFAISSAYQQEEFTDSLSDEQMLTQQNENLFFYDESSSINSHSIQALSRRNSLDFLALESLESIMPDSGPLHENSPGFNHHSAEILDTPIEERFAPYSDIDALSRYQIQEHMQLVQLNTPILDAVNRRNSLSPSKLRKLFKRPTLMPLITNFSRRFSSIKSAPIKQVNTNISKLSSITESDYPYPISASISPYSALPSIHNNLKCTNCNKQFTRAQNLKTHMLTHTDEVAFACTECAQGFKRLPDLKRHYKSIHLKEKEFMCVHGCGMGFSRRDALKRHLMDKSQGACAQLRASHL